MLLEVFKEIPDHRRGQGRMYDLPHILLFSVLAIISGANSYRQVHSFIKTHFETLKEIYELSWKRVPAYTTIRYTIQGVEPKALEKAFRKHANNLVQINKARVNHISLDGKTLRGSFDHFQDKKAIQLFSALFTSQKIILAHEQITDQKTNEIPKAQKLIKELGLEGYVITADALHCQKKR